MTVQRAVKKARKARFPAFQDGERVVYCIRCLRGSHEVEWMAYEPFFTICNECIRDLAKFMEHSLEKQRHTQTQPEPDESESEMGGEPEVA